MEVDDWFGVFNGFFCIGEGDCFLCDVFVDWVRVSYDCLYVIKDWFNFVEVLSFVFYSGFVLLLVVLKWVLVVWLSGVVDVFGVEV